MPEIPIDTAVFSWANEMFNVQILINSQNTIHHGRVGVGWSNICHSSNISPSGQYGEQIPIIILDVGILPDSFLSISGQ